MTGTGEIDKLNTAGAVEFDDGALKPVEEVVHGGNGGKESKRIIAGGDTMLTSTTPEELFDILIESIKKYHPSDDLSMVRKAYEILVEVCGEMERGLGEKEAYEQLGERWGLLSYRTLSSILVQCLQKGSVGVEQILAKEAEQAQRLRRQQAQILGEQASTRLLFPMILMLLVVFVILLVPAWLTFAV